MAERNVLRLVSCAPTDARAICSPAAGAAAAAGGGLPSRMTSYTQATPKSTMITTPTATIHQLTSKPTSANATPTATPIGQRLAAAA